MIYFNGEISMLEKYASGVVTFVILFSIAGYILIINSLLPFSGCFVK